MHGPDRQAPRSMVGVLLVLAAIVFTLQRSRRPIRCTRSSARTLARPDRGRAPQARLRQAAAGAVLALRRRPAARQPAELAAHPPPGHDRSARTTSRPRSSSRSSRSCSPAVLASSSASRRPRAWRGAGVFRFVMWPARPRRRSCSRCSGCCSSTTGWTGCPRPGAPSYDNAPTGPTELLTVDSLIHGRLERHVDAIKHLILPGLCVAIVPAVSSGACCVEHHRTLALRLRAHRAREGPGRAARCCCGTRCATRSARRCRWPACRSG